MEIAKEKIINKYILLTIIIVFALFLLYSLREFFTGFLASIMFYVLFKPWMETLVLKWKWEKSRAALVIITISFFIILLPIVLLGAMLYGQLNILLAESTTILNNLHELDELIKQRFHIELLSNKNISDAQSFIANMLSGVLNQSLSVFSTIGMMYFFLYFMLIHTGRMEATIVFYLPFKRQRILLFGDELKSQTFSNAIGVPLIAVTQGLCGVFLYWGLGLPQAGFWGLMTGFASIIPIVGTSLVWLPAGLYLLAMGFIWQAVVLLFCGAIILGSLDNVIRFVLAKQMADVHPIITILGIVIGLDYFALPGLIFGPLIISYFFILLKIYYAEYDENGSAKNKKKPAALAIKLPFINYSKKK